MESKITSDILSRHLFVLMSICLAFFPLDLAASTLSLKNYTGIECGQSDVVQEHEMCGVDFYRAASTANCPSVFENRQQESCGVAAYITAATAFCGIESFNEGPSRACPGYVSPDRKFISDHNRDPSCPGGYREISRTSNRCDECEGRAPHNQRGGTVTCVRDEKVTRCQLPDFGVAAYKTCADPNHGVASWNWCSVHAGYETCRHPGHGVEKYKSCVIGKTPNTCQVYFTPQELSVWIATQDTELTFKVNNLLKWSANYYSAEKDSNSLGCLIKRVITNSGFAGNPVFDQSVLADLMSHYRNTASREFKIDEFEGNECKAPLSSIATAICLPEDSSTRCSSLSGYRTALSNLEDLQSDLSKIKSDTVARANNDVFGRVSTLESRITTAINESKKNPQE